jgi:hypothetical protein
MNDRPIEVDFSGNIEIDHPKCVHGPTLLFRSSTSRFFACSACRDRRECNICIPYKKRNEKSSQNIIKQHEKQYEAFKKHIQITQKNRKKFNKQSNM